MQLKIFSLVFAILLVAGVVSAHAWGVDPSYANYTLSSVTSYDSSRQVYVINATLTMCSQIPGSFSWTAWCSGTAGKCCPGGINEFSGECNTLSNSDSSIVPCVYNYQDSCSIFGNSDPVKSCMKACPTSNYVKGGDIGGSVKIVNSSICQKGSKYSTFAWQETKTFETSNLNNFIISAGYSYQDTPGHDKLNPSFPVPIFTKAEYRECSSDSDCGPQMCTEIGSYCNSGNLYHDYSESKCESGMCVKKIVSKVIAYCNYACSESKCVSE